MTDRSNDAPGDDLEPTTDQPTADQPTADELAEEAPDLTQQQLDDAASAAQDDVDAESMGEGDFLDDERAAVEADEDELAEEGEDAEEAEGAAAPAPRLGARARAEEEARRRREARLRREQPERRSRFSLRNRGEEEEEAPRSARTQIAIDPALRIKDPWSSAFVAATLIVFLLVFLNAMAFGKGGAFTPRPTPTPVVSISPAPSVSPGTSPGASGSAAPSIAPTGSPVAPSPSTAPAGT